MNDRELFNAAMKQHQEAVPTAIDVTNKVLNTLHQKNQSTSGLSVFLSIVGVSMIVAVTVIISFTTDMQITNSSWLAYFDSFNVKLP